MQNETTCIEFPVSLTRDEYIHSQQLLAKANRLRPSGTAMTWMTVAMLPVSLVALIADRHFTGVWDLQLLSALVMLFAVDLVLLIAMPHIVRRRHAQAYDSTCFGGYSFDGVIRANDYAVTKQTREGETTVSYAECPLFVEETDMMIFCTAQGRSIVIPAAYLTPADAEALRRCALRSVPPARRRLLSKLVPRLVTRLAPFETEKAAEQVLLTVPVEMTKREMTDLLTDVFVGELPAMLPFRATWALVMAIAGYMLFNMAPVPLFFLCFLLFVLVPMLSVGFKVSRAVQQTDGAVLKPTVEFTDLAVHIRGKGETARSVRIPWGSITRAVECPDRVELFAGRKLISIPKRCIADMEQLRAVVDEHYIK